MEEKDLKIVPKVEVVRFGIMDFLKGSNNWSLDENELPAGPRLD